MHHGPHLYRSVFHHAGSNELANGRGSTVRERGNVVKQKVPALAGLIRGPARGTSGRNAEDALVRGTGLAALGPVHGRAPHLDAALRDDGRDPADVAELLSLIHI